MLKKHKIRSKIKPGDSKSLWKAVNESKDIGTNSLPILMTLAGSCIHEHERSDHFAKIFENKTLKIRSVQFFFFAHKFF